MVFADDERESNPTSFKFLQMAHAWKNAQAKKTGTGSAVLSGFTAATQSDSTRYPSNDNQAAHPGNADGQDDAGSDVASSHGGD
jgi:crooked neck